MKPEHLKLEEMEQSLTVGTIYDTTQKKTIDFDELIEQLSDIRVI
jgi:hypothetical protein